MIKLTRQKDVAGFYILVFSFVAFSSLPYSISTEIQETPVHVYIEVTCMKKKYVKLTIVVEQFTLANHIASCTPGAMGGLKQEGWVFTLRDESTCGLYDPYVGITIFNVGTCDATSDMFDMTCYHSFSDDFTLFGS